MNHIKLKTVNLKNNPQFNERWLQDIIAEEPTILGIGDVTLRDKERNHIGAGRLDLLLQDINDHTRYEVEIQLGAIDESHIIRTIEYWDIERRRFPQYNHTAVIIAEDITSRFLNVISLFNGFIPIMAIQVTAIETPEGVGLQFTKILNTIRLGNSYEDEKIAEQTDRKYWETKKGTKKTVSLADRILEITKAFSPSAKLNYTKNYIGFWVDGRACNFTACRLQKNALHLEIKLPKTEKTDNIITNSKLDCLDYDKGSRQYRLILTEKDIIDKKDILSDLLRQAFELRK